MRSLSEAATSTLASIDLLIFDFDGVFTDNAVYVREDGKEWVRCSRSDGLGLSRLRSLGVAMVIVSTEKNPVVSRRAEKLQLACRQSVADKKQAVLAIMAEHSVPSERTAFIGNDINDIPAMGEVGLKIGVQDAYPELLAHVDYQTEKTGGNGAVREICDHIYFARKSQGESS